jgi:hypothetical protein
MEAARNMADISPPVMPNSSLFSAYREKYKKYSAVCASLDTVWDRFEV